MNENEIQQAQRVIDSVRDGEPLGDPLQAVFPSKETKSISKRFTIEVLQEKDGRWLADIPSVPGANGVWGECGRRS